MHRFSMDLSIPAPPQSLILSTLCTRKEIDEALERGYYRIPKDWWYICFRETHQQAIVRLQDELHIKASKETHVILDVEFTPFGVAHFTTTFDDQFHPVLHKAWKREEKGNWHFTRDLPMVLHDSQYNLLINTEIWDTL